jgi:hypothetical protein
VTKKNPKKKLPLEGKVVGLTASSPVRYSTNGRGLLTAGAGGIASMWMIHTT